MSRFSRRRMRPIWWDADKLTTAVDSRYVEEVVAKNDLDAEDLQSAMDDFLASVSFDKTEKWENFPELDKDPEEREP